MQTQSTIHTQRTMYLLSYIDFNPLLGPCVFTVYVCGAGYFATSGHSLGSLKALMLETIIHDVFVQRNQ